MERAPADDWEGELERWLAPFLERLQRQAQRRWAPVYLKGLIPPGERKGVEPMAARIAPGDTQQLHHFVSASPWAAAPLEDELVKAADRLVGGPDAVLVVDDTALAKQGRHSVGVQRQYCGQLGKRANRQSLVSLTLARPRCRSASACGCSCPRTGVRSRAARRGRGARGDRLPAQVGGRAGRDRPRACLGRPLRLRAGRRRVRQGGRVPRRPRRRRLPFAVGILPAQKVYPADVAPPVPSARRPAGRASTRGPRPERGRRRAARGPAGGVPHHLVGGPAPRGRLRAAFAALRVRVADGPVAAGGRHLPGEEAWLVGEHRASGERKYYLANHPAGTPLEVLAALIKARWVCEQMHQQLKGELGLGHFEGRGWRGLHHHVLLCQLAFAFLQHLRLGGESVGTPPEPGPPPRPSLPAVRRRIVATLPRVLLRCPHCRQRFGHHLRL
jgi:hypothetical protein